jgi:hypothetical protein
MPDSRRRKSGSRPSSSAAADVPQPAGASRAKAAMVWDDVLAPPLDTAVSELVVEDVRFDLRESFQFIGLTFGPDDHAVTMGFAARRNDIQIERGGRIVTLGGLALSFNGVTRFETSFPEGRSGDLDYIERRHDPEDTLVFFFEHGTIRVSGSTCRGEILIEDSSSSSIQ